MVSGSSSLCLTDLRVGEKAIISNLRGGRGVASRLTSLGFTPGAEVRMLQNVGTGPLIVIVRGTRVALGRGEATKIDVNSRE
jgi:ferrous iron transport protein A